MTQKYLINSSPGKTRLNRELSTACQMKEKDRGSRVITLKAAGDLGRKDPCDHQPKAQATRPVDELM